MTTLLFPLYYHSNRIPSGMTPREYLFWRLFPFGIAFIYLIYKYFRNKERVVSWKNGQIPKNFEPSEKNIVEVYIVLAASATKRGRTHVQSKEKLIKEYVEEHFPKVVCLVDESFDHVIWNSVDLPEIIFWCNTHLNAQQKLQLFEFLVVIVEIDGEVIPEELELIYYILNKFSIPYSSLSDYAKKAIEVEEEPQRSQTTSVSGKQRMLSVLGLKDGVSLLEIKRTYRLLVKQVHPDRHPNATEQERAVLVARFQQLQEAYDYLTK